MLLSPRLLKIANMVSYKSAADIGTDHAKLPVFLVKNSICDSVIASDVADGPVLACHNNISVNDLSDVIQVFKADGLSVLQPGQVETIIIAGMGGDLISSILSNGIEVARSAKEIILQPMTHIPELRKFLCDNEFFVVDEALVKEKDKIYTVIKIQNGVCQYKDEIDFVVSPVLIENRDAVLKELLLKLIKKYNTKIMGLENAYDRNDSKISAAKSILNSLEKIYEVAKNY